MAFLSYESLCCLSRVSQELCLYWKVDFWRQSHQGAQKREQLGLLLQITSNAAISDPLIITKTHKLTERERASTTLCQQTHHSSAG